MTTLWMEDESTGIDFEFQAEWHWEDAGIGWYDFHGNVEFDNTKEKVIDNIELSDWDATYSDYEDNAEIKELSERYLVDNYEEIERKLYELI